MKNFKDFFQELYEFPPTPYERFGERGKDAWSDIVSEGIIHSYPIDKLEKALKDISPESHINIKDGIIYHYSHRTPDDGEMGSIQKTANGYGWIIVKNYFNDKLDNHVMVFEPNHPKHLTSEQIQEGNFYHITSQRIVNKIEKIGLAPKLSRTAFNHPGDRIYLFQIINRKNINHDLDQLKQILGQDIILKVTIPPSWVVYFDPMFQVPDGMRACFVRKNIPPHLIVKN